MEAVEAARAVAPRTLSQEAEEETFHLDKVKGATEAVDGTSNERSDLCRARSDSVVAVVVAAHHSHCSLHPSMK